MKLENDCLNYMQVDGRPVRAARIFLGNEHAVQVEKLSQHFAILANSVVTSIL